MKRIKVSIPIPIIVQNGICAIEKKDNSVMIVSEDFVVKPVKGE